MRFGRRGLGSRCDPGQAALVDKLGKLIRLLASDTPGEAIGAVYAIRRTLASAGLDLRDLARTVEAGGLRKSTAKKRSRPSGDSVDWPAFAARILREHAHELPEKEVDFCNTMSMWDGAPSPKQQKWLKDIAARFARAA
jgi:hypothetical protein